MKKLFLPVIFVLIILCFVLFKHDFFADKKTVLRFSSWGSQSETALLLPLIKEFERKNPDIKIEFLHIPQNYFQKLHLLFASNLAPDVVFLNNYYAPKYVKAGLLEDLTPYIKRNEYFEKSLEGFTFNSKIYAIPRDVSEVVVYYNKDIFKKKNIPYPDDDWTISDYVNIAGKLSEDTNNDGKNDIWGSGYETDTIFWLPFLISNGAAILSDDGQKVMINSTAAAKALNLYSDIANRYHAAPQKSQSASLTMAQLFLQQKIAMHISGRWLVPKYRSDAEFDWDVVRFPKGTNGSVVNIDASGYAISKASKHKEEAIAFVEYISSKNCLKTLSKSGLIVPARKDAAYSDSFLSQEAPKNAIAFLKTVETGKATPVNENYRKITDELNIILEPVFLGKKKAEDVLPSVAEKFNRF